MIKTNGMVSFEGRRHLAIPPGETVKDLLRERGIRYRDFLYDTGIDRADFEKLLQGRLHITQDVANRLEAGLEISAQFWLNLEGIYRRDRALVDAENKLRMRAIRRKTL